LFELLDLKFIIFNGKISPEQEIVIFFVNEDQPFFEKVSRHSTKEKDNDRKTLKIECNHSKYM